jgi:mRNA-degrading endonuclease RelE of RelBE toxin-antitoxin system
MAAKWKVKFSGKAARQVKRLPERFQDTVDALRRDIEANGPAASNWPNYGKLKGRPGYHHCHLNKGKPRYVAVCLVNEEEIRLVEIRYVGTHEKANYGKTL